MQNIFPLLMGVHYLSHYYSEKFIRNSRTVNFLFLTTVHVVMYMQVECFHSSMVKHLCYVLQRFGLVNILSCQLNLQCNSQLHL